MIHYGNIYYIPHTNAVGGTVGVPPTGRFLLYEPKDTSHASNQSYHAIKPDWKRLHVCNNQKTEFRPKKWPKSGKIYQTKIVRINKHNHYMQ